MRSVTFPLTMLMVVIAMFVVIASEPVRAGADQPPDPPPYEMVTRSEQGDARIVSREGWTRTESTAGSFRHLRIGGPEGRVYALVFSSEGTPISLGLYRNGLGTPERQRTEMTDVVLGENCQVWASAPPFEERVYGGPWLECITDDGIVLWTGRGRPGTDGPTIHTRAVELERRTTDWSQFRLPRETLTWSYWSRYFELPPEGSGRGYEIRFGQRVLRVRDHFSYETYGPRGFSIRTSNSCVQSYERDGYVGFEIQTGPERPYPPDPRMFGSEVMARPPLRLFGETCRWHRVDLGVRWGVVSVCMSDDGIRMGEATDFNDPQSADEYEVASYFRRGAPAAELMLPPPSVFDPWIAAQPN